MSRFFGGRFFGGRLFGGRFFGGSSAPSSGTAVANPIHVFGWPIYSDRNAVYTPTFSGGSWETTLPASNLGDRRLARVARSTDALLASTTFDVDLKAPRAVGLLALPKHGMSTSAQVRWRGSSIAGDYSSPVYDTGWLTVWPSGATVEDLDGLNVSHVHVLPDLETARYWRCEISDASNAAGYVQLSRVVVAGTWYPSTTAAIGAKIGLESLTERVVSDGGAALYRSRPVRRYWDFTIPMIEETEAFAQAFKMQRQLGSHGQLFFVWDTADSYMHERAFLCVLRELTVVEYPFAALNSVPFRLLEEL